IGRVITINPKEIELKGEKRKIFYGMIADESAVLPFTAWRDFNIGKGQVIRVTNAYTKSWQGIAQLNFGEYTKIEPSEEEIPETQEPRKCKVEELKSGLGSTEIVAKILSIKDKEVEVGGTKRKVYFGIIADETGKAQFTSWHDFNLKEGDVVKIVGGYVKSWRGIPQLTFDEKCKVEKLESKKIKEVNIRKYKLWELIEKGGALDIEVEGNVIEVREGSGIIIRCPECNRVLSEGKCKVHGSVNGIYDLRAKIILDDGTGAVNVIVNRDLTEKILNKSLEELKKIYDEAKDNASKLINNNFLAKKIKVIGNALRDGFGTTIIAKEAEIVDIDVKEEAKKLLQEVREVSGSYEA
ncbi:MAG: DNA-binding protein, partial [Chloroflexi bacterium]